jgi:flagellar basal body-associated protein FliL
MLMNRSKILALALLAAVFVAGGIVGIAASGAWRGHRASVADRRPPRETTSYADRLQREVNLTPAQHDSVEQIVTGYQGHMDRIWAEIRPRMDSLRDDIRAQIMMVLDSTQQARYRALIARSDSIRAARAQEGRHGR